METDAERMPINIYRAVLSLDVVEISPEDVRERLTDMFELPDFDLVDLEVRLRDE